MSEYTWKDALKDVPKTFKQGCINGYNYWRVASLRMWVAEILWLIILVAMFYYGAHGIVGFFKTTTIDPNSGLGWFVSFLPLYFVAVLFAVHAVFSRIVSAVFMWMDRRADRNNT